MDEPKFGIDRRTFLRSMLVGAPLITGIGRQILLPRSPDVQGVVTNSKLISRWGEPGKIDNYVRYLENNGWELSRDPKLRSQPPIMYGDRKLGQCFFMRVGGRRSAVFNAHVALGVIASGKPFNFIIEGLGLYEQIVSASDWKVSPLITPNSIPKYPEAYDGNIDLGYYYFPIGGDIGKDFDTEFEDGERILDDTLRPINQIDLDKNQLYGFYRRGVGVVPLTYKGFRPNGAYQQFEIGDNQNLVCPGISNSMVTLLDLNGHMTNNLVGGISARLEGNNGLELDPTGTFYNTPCSNLMGVRPLWAL